MKPATLNHGNPTELELKRIKEINSLSYYERLERLVVLIELSRELKNAPKVYPIKK